MRPCAKYDICLRTLKDSSTLNNKECQLPDRTCEHNVTHHDKKGTCRERKEHCDIPVLWKLILSTHWRYLSCVDWMLYFKFFGYDNLNFTVFSLFLMYKWTSIMLKWFQPTSAPFGVISYNFFSTSHMLWYVMTRWKIWRLLDTNSLDLFSKACLTISLASGVTRNTVQEMQDK